MAEHVNKQMDELTAYHPHSPVLGGRWEWDLWNLQAASSMVRLFPTRLRRGMEG
jgi:hypothetical protein